jgi:hypothetical protein
VDQAGAALADAWLHVEVLPDEPPPERAGQSPPSSVYFTFRCDGEGAFHYPLYLPASVPGGRSVVVSERRREGFPRGVVARYAEASLPEPLPFDGDVDLGDLVMRPLPVLLAGQVVDSNGAPVRSARMFIRYPYGPEGQEGWHYLNADKESLDADGRFVVHGVQRVRALKVSATSQGDEGWSQEVVVPPGTTDLVLELVPPEPEPEGGVVLGTVLLDPGVPPLELEVYLKWKGGSEDDYVFPPGLFRFDPVPPGSAVLELELQDTDYELARVEGIEVRVGETTTLDPIDLRGALAVLPVRVMKDSGQPVSDTTCWVSSPDDRGGSFRTDRDGRASLLLPTRHDLFTVRTNGYAPATCGWSTAEQTLVLMKQDG